MELAESRTDFAEDRTVLANERTFAGWLRTGYAGSVKTTNIRIASYGSVLATVALIAAIWLLSFEAAG